MSKKMVILTIVAIVVVIALPVAGLVLKSGSEFGGADSGGQAAITEIDPTYKPWFNNIWNQSTHTNEVMFGFQGLLGAGILFGALGYFVGRTRGRTEAEAGKESPLSSGVKIAYALIGVAVFSVIPLLYFAVGYRPPSSEIICLFFALSGGIASGFICFAVFFFRGRRSGLARPTEPQLNASAL
jgi:cobalt/nickel transport protein